MYSSCYKLMETFPKVWVSLFGWQRNGLHVRSRFHITIILLESKNYKQTLKMRLHHQVYFDFLLIVISKLVSIKTRMVVMFTTTLSSKWLHK